MRRLQIEKYPDRRDLKVIAAPAERTAAHACPDCLSAFPTEKLYKEHWNRVHAKRTTKP